jgi:FAD/FMN-containing dehydrogenase|tara:strand:+ start:1704 stop:3017 length:1314 start_codon:yes stop_codon:yes gene_type:complete
MKYKSMLSGWGNNINIESNIYFPKNDEDISNLFSQDKILNLIPRGLGRSYGDCSLAENVISLKDYKKFINFDNQLGIIECSANCSLSELLKLIVKKSWFFNVTPGSKFVTIGGAIASDVHGKNHHLDGSFSDYVISFKIITGEGILYNCDKKENSDLFHATCGGMGLTGIIVSAKIKLLKIKSKFINTQIIKTKNLKDTILKFKELKNQKYLVAWIDALSKNESIGRSVIFIGNHSDDGNLELLQRKKIKIPSIFPGFILNQYTIKLFNKTYYFFHRNKKKFKQSLDNFFYPLDNINNWNNLYGKNGFIQIQVLIEKEDSEKIIGEILKFFQEKNQFSFLSTIKELGSGNANYLSFPCGGYTLTLDLKMNGNLKDVYREFELLLKNYKTKIYLTKDSLMSEQYFKNTYKNFNKFIEIKEKYDPSKLISSFQSRRLGI